jgi:hypothetical protein
MTVLADLTRNVMRAAGVPIAWIAANERAVGRALAMHTEIRRAESFDLTTLSVALRQLRNLTITRRRRAVARRSCRSLTEGLGIAVANGRRSRARRG